MTQERRNLKPYRTVFVVELEQTTGLSSGGRDGALYADAIMARDGAGRFILRGSGLAGALLATLDDFDIDIPNAVSARLPEPRKQSEKYESLWLLHHAHLMDQAPTAEVRPNVAIHAWTGAAADGLKFDTETLPRGTRWRFLVETDDWRDENYGTEHGAAPLLALALREWQQGRCWLGRSPARGLGWARLIGTQIYRLDRSAADKWPNARKDTDGNLKDLERLLPHRQKHHATLDDVIAPHTYGRRARWHVYNGTITVGEREDGYGLDSLSTLGRDFPDSMPKEWMPVPESKDDANGNTEADNPDHVVAWTRPVIRSQAHAAKPKGKEATRVTSQAAPTPFIPGSSIRGALRANVSRLWRQAGHSVWSPNDAAHTASKASDPLLPLFGSIKDDAHLLVSDAYPVDTAPQVYVQELHAEDEFTQGTYASAKFNRPCIVSGTFGFRIAIKERLSHPTDEGAANEGGLGPAGAATARQVIAMIDALGKARQLPLGGGIWRGHGWVDIALQPDSEHDDGASMPHSETTRNARGSIA